jgi:toxin ParE1/3/4
VRLRIRAKARRDLDEILDYSFAEHGEEVAEGYLLTIGAALDRLIDYPELGLARFDLKEGLRSLPAGEHRIYYRIEGDRVSVARVLHKAMDPARHF